MFQALFDLATYSNYPISNYVRFRELEIVDID